LPMSNPKPGLAPYTPYAGSYSCNGVMQSIVSRICFGVSLALALSSDGTAHPMGNFSINHYTKIFVTTSTVELFTIIDMAEIPTFQEVPQLDLNKDGKVSSDERKQYLDRRVDEILEQLHLSLNGRRLRLERVSEQLELLPGGMNLPTMRVSVRSYVGLAANGWQPLNVISFKDQTFAGRPGWKEIVATVGPGVALIASSVPATDKSQQLTVYPEDPTIIPPDVVSAGLKLKLSSGDSPAVSENGGSPRVSANGAFPPTDIRTQEHQEKLTQLLSSSTLNWSIVAMAMIVAFGLGAFHALSPGHGKTVVGAYLVGTQGTARHAVLLGIIVTVTHTLGVFLLGFVTLYASQYILPEKLLPWLGFVSGLGVVIIGLGLFLQRYRNLYLPQHSHGHDLAHHHHHHHHDHAHDLLGHHEHDHHHQHLDDHHEHDQDHHHAHPANDHGPGLVHSHGSVTHSHDYSQVRFRDILTLGITGGMVPCPSALVVLLAAISLNRVGLGLLMIVAFSFGLALVLIIIGLLMIYARGMLDRFSGGGKLWRVVPVFSSLAVALLGAVIAVQSLMGGGILKIQF
jgi:nickel/cobalt transporter (NicO) family protein